MTRLIDADALLEVVNAWIFNVHDNRHVEDIIKDAPTIEREGWVSVPIEPTENMLEAVLNGTPYVDDNKQLMRNAYKAMIQAAPKE